MTKPKKRRNKKYRPRQVAYHDILDIDGRDGISDEAADRLDVGFRMQIEDFRQNPSWTSYAYVIGTFLICDRLSYDVVEGDELRKDFTTGWRRMEDAWAVWIRDKQIAHANLDFVSSLSTQIYDFFKHFSYHEIAQAREYVSKHNLKPVGYEG